MCFSYSIFLISLWITVHLFWCITQFSNLMFHCLMPAFVPWSMWRTCLRDALSLKRVLGLFFFFSSWNVAMPAQGLYLGMPFFSWFVKCLFKRLEKNKISWLQTSGWVLLFASRFHYFNIEIFHCYSESLLSTLVFCNTEKPLQSWHMQRHTEISEAMLVV